MQWKLKLKQLRKRTLLKMFPQINQRLGKISSFLAVDLNLNPNKKTRSFKLRVLIF